MPRANPANNRSDLPGKVASTVTAPDQAYGARTAQEQSMKMLPVAAPSATATPAAPQPAGGPSPAGGAPDIGAMFSAPTPFEQLGGHYMQVPSQSGNPVTTGLPTGAGPGAEARGPILRQADAQKYSEQGTVQSLLSHLASQPGASSMTKALASAAGVPTR
jgi:hypothetical protein